MLKPTKHLDLEISTLNIASIILKEMSKNKILKYDILFGKVAERVGEDAKFNFINALGLLYLLGRIIYYKKTDSFEFHK